MHKTLSPYITEMLLRFADKPSGEVEAAVRMVVERLEEGHVCLNLGELAGQSGISPEGREMVFPDLQQWCDCLRASGVVGHPGQYFPLILDSHLLYFHRYYKYEKRVADFVRSRRGRYTDAVDPEKLKSGLLRLFPGQAETAGRIDWQKVAAFLVLTGRFTVISGGPGTGKTTTVARILALLLEQEPETRIRLGAPTGKAAALLQESLVRARECLPMDSRIMEAFPDKVSTVHRLLGKVRGGRTFRQDKKLAADIVIIDEASMVDLPLMAELMAAIPDPCSLVLLGDRHQLASVQPGAVFADICRENLYSFSRECAVLARECRAGEIPSDASDAGADMLVELKTNYRFAADSGIGLLSRLINEGRQDEVVDLLVSDRAGGVSWYDLDRFPGSQALGEIVSRTQRHWKRLTRISDPVEALAEMRRTVILCGLRRGPFGAVTINRLLENAIGPGRRHIFYQGQPVMVLANDYKRDLYNGDTGIICRTPAGGKEQEFGCFFHGRPEGISPFKLPEHETAYAVTVHKSQGSEYDHIVLVLPETSSAVLTRELLYTGITRARHSLEIWSSAEVLRETVRKKTQRPSGLAGRLNQEEGFCLKAVDVTND